MFTLYLVPSMPTHPCGSGGTNSCDIPCHKVSTTSRTSTVGWFHSNGRGMESTLKHQLNDHKWTYFVTQLKKYFRDHATLKVWSQQKYVCFFIKTQASDGVFRNCMISIEFKNFTNSFRIIVSTDTSYCYNICDDPTVKLWCISRLRLLPKRSPKLYECFTFTLKVGPIFRGCITRPPNVVMLQVQLDGVTTPRFHPFRLPLGMAQKEGHEKIFTDRVGGKPAGFATSIQLQIESLGCVPPEPPLSMNWKCLVQDHSLIHKKSCRKSWCPYVQDSSFTINLLMSSKQILETLVIHSVVAMRI